MLGTAHSWRWEPPRGRPPPWDMLRRAITVACAWCCLLSGMHAGEVALRVRLEWGGGVERAWQGTLHVDPGALSTPQSLSFDTDAPGSLRVEAGRVVIQPARKRTYDGCDVSLIATTEATLRLQLSDDSGFAKTVELPVAQLLDESLNISLDEQGNRLLARRAPGDRLRVSLPREHLVFAPGETFLGRVQPHRLSASAGHKLHYEAKLLTRQGRAVWSDERDITMQADESWPAIDWSCQLPSEEGVYDLVLQLSRRVLGERLLPRGAIEERRVQVVVLAPRAVDTPRAGTWQLDTLLEMDPTHPSWRDRLAPLNTSWPRGPITRRAPLFNQPLSVVSHPLGALAQLNAAAENSELAWQAYPLPIARPGQPHVLEVDYPADFAQVLGISIVDDPSLAGAQPIGLDSGVYVEPLGPASVAGMARHRLIFWPRSTNTWAIVSNQRRRSPAVFSKLRLLGPRASTIPSLPNLALAPLPDLHLPRAISPAAPTSERTLAAYFDRPLFVENFGAPQATDPGPSPIGRPLDDWQTFLDGGRRLIEYLQYVGYNGLVLNVYADGSALYPSEVVEPSPRYDDGALFSSGQDPQRKDVVELLMRLCDRESIRLVPAMQFTAPLPSLEALRHGSDSEAVALQLYHSDGQRADMTSKPGAPLYNPLHPRVQQAMLEAITEVVERYGSHPSFQGLAVQLSPQGFTQLPSADWGCDPDTLARFFREQKSPITWYANDPWGQARSLVRGTHRAAWLAWRARELHAFYQRVAAVVTRKRSDAKLYLLTGDLLQSPESQRQLRPELPRKMPADELIRDTGIDPALFAAEASVVICTPQRIEPLDSLHLSATDLEFNERAAPAIRLHAGQARTSLLYHPPLESRLNIEYRPGQKSVVRLVSQLSPAGARNRQRFAHALAVDDAQWIVEGGWMLPLGQEDELRELVAVFRQLPSGPFETLAGSTQPVTIRMHRRDDRTYFYWVNDSPWHATVTQTIRAQEHSRLDSLGSPQRFSSTNGPSAERELTIDLAPYDVVAGVSTDPQARLASPRVRLAPQAQAWLEGQIGELWNRLGTLKSPPLLTSVANADFEVAGSRSQPAQWELEPREGSMATIDPTQRHGGQHSLRLKAQGAGAQLRSRSFSVPASGRLSISAWLRIEEGAPQPSVRLGIARADGDASYARFAQFGAIENAQPLQAKWTQYLFQVTDWPSDNVPLHVRIELSGVGTVWLDDLELLDLDFSDTERTELSKVITLIDYKRKNHELADAMQLLQGYWPRFLLSQVPKLDEFVSPPEVMSSEKQPAPPVAQPRPSGLYDRFKQWLPRWSKNG